ncbi:BQ5605_C001g00490 [Microbotryum silenes-dioicae]|uniref:BQ5605_C001g00490 protein n=1 Tax=Microbotryum silenes-dioicae TaxID=796604 RepID=A0A2X0M3I1_9BASI|nr:BQ5605_C001g00490 [Microbotryum silenes-dioicae]
MGWRETRTAWTTRRKVWTRIPRRSIERACGLCSGDVFEGLSMWQAWGRDANHVHTLGRPGLSCSFVSDQAIKSNPGGIGPLGALRGRDPEAHCSLLQQAGVMWKKMTGSKGHVHHHRMCRTIPPIVSRTDEMRRASERRRIEHAVSCIHLKTECPQREGNAERRGEQERSSKERRKMKPTVVDKALVVLLECLGRIGGLPEVDRRSALAPSLGVVCHRCGDDRTDGRSKQFSNLLLVDVRRQVADHDLIPNALDPCGGRSAGVVVGSGGGVLLRSRATRACGLLLCRGGVGSSGCSGRASRLTRSALLLGRDDLVEGLVQVLYGCRQVGCDR